MGQKCKEPFFRQINSLQKQYVCIQLSDAANHAWKHLKSSEKSSKMLKQMHSPY